jgi:hypothetical protein
MSKHVVTQLGTFQYFIRQYTSEQVCQQVLQGSEKITIATSLERVARWTHTALLRLESLVDEQSILQILSARGQACASLGQKNVAKARKRRLGYPTQDAFLDAEMQIPQRGFQLTREGNTLIQTYTPRDFHIHCYCPLMRKLPDGMNVPVAYCECSRAFVEWTWSAILDRPVKVLLLESCLSGSKQCRFAIHYP